MSGRGHLWTRAVHAGRGPRVPGTPLNPPVVLASSFHDDGYAREQGSPAWEPLEAALGELEGGTAVAYASGVAAAAAAVDALPAGARVVAPVSGYAWTRTLLERHAASGRIALETLDMTRTDDVLAAAHGAQAVWLDGFGAMLSFEVAGGAAQADAVCARVEVLTHAKSLGGVESLIERRARAAASGAPAGLLRISVGCEHPEDLWADLAQALLQDG